MTIYKRTGGWYWTDFSTDGVRYRKPLKTTDWREAKKKERELIEAARDGHLETCAGPKFLFEAVEKYLAAKAFKCSPRTVELEGERLSIVKKHFGNIKLTAITPEAITKYQQTRHKAQIANRTINMDVGALRRVLKHCRRWRKLQDYVDNLPENQKPIGRALTQEEQQRLFKVAANNPDWEHVYCAAILAANTSMRPVEVKHLRWWDVDLFKATVSIKRSKNQSSHRLIPLNQAALKALNRMRDRATLLGFSEPGHYVWPACQWHRFDPTKPIKKWDTAWRRLCKTAGLTGLRFHDLRHTIITELAEMGVPDHVLESITGHLSRHMLEHYSHIRLQAKRNALEALDLRRKKASNVHSSPAAVQ